MLLEVLEARQRVLGPDHPDTLKTAALKGIDEAPCRHQRESIAGQHASPRWGTAAALDAMPPPAHDAVREGERLRGDRDRRRTR